MSCKEEWREDCEAAAIAAEVLEKYIDVEGFDKIDPLRIKFVRVLNKDSKKGVKLHTVGFPFNIDCPYLYYMVVNDGWWQQHNEEQRNIAVFAGLYEIAPGGMDNESVNYGKKRKRDIEDFDEVIAVAGGRYDWQKVGITGIHNILSSDAFLYRKEVDIPDDGKDMEEV